MTTAQNSLRYIFFSVWAVLMTALTYILGAPPLKVVRRKVGRVGYWALMTLVSVGIYFLQAKMLAVAFFSLVVLIGVFDEFEEMGFSFSLSAFFTLLINSLLSGGAFALWVFYSGPKWSQTILTSIEAVLKPVVELNPRIQISYFDLMLQLPSIAIISWMAALYVAILLESRMLGAAGADDRRPAPAMRPQLATLRLPDMCIWVFIASLLGAFGGIHVQVLEAIAVNTLNVCLMLFFFQGIAVVAKFFESVRMNSFWQTLFMALIVIQLFLFVSLLGLVDYWVDIRARLAKRSEQKEKEFKRET